MDKDDTKACTSACTAECRHHRTFVNSSRYQHKPISWNAEFWHQLPMNVFTLSCVNPPCQPASFALQVLLSALGITCKQRLLPWIVVKCSCPRPCRGRVNERYVGGRGFAGPAIRRPRNRLEHPYWHHQVGATTPAYNAPRRMSSQQLLPGFPQHH